MIKNLRHILPVMLAVLIILCTGCGSEEEPEVTTSTITQTTAPTEEVTEEPTEPEGTVLFDDKDVKIIATGLKETWLSHEIGIHIRNTSDQNVLVTARDISVNGYMMEMALLYAETAPGENCDTGLFLDPRQLEQSGIETIGQVQFYLELTEAESCETIATSELITLDITEEPVEQPVNDEGEPLYDEGGIRVVSQGLQQSSLWDDGLILYIENNTDDAIIIQAESVRINDVPVSATLWSPLRGQTRCVSGMSVLGSQGLALSSPEGIHKIEFNLRILNAETYSEISTGNPITLTFNQ